VQRFAELPVADGTRVLVRADLNVPLDKATGAITDDLRIVESLPTVRALLDRGAAVILCSHLGRPNGEVRPELSLAPIADALARQLDRPVELLGVDATAPSPIVGPAVRARCAALAPGEVVVLENLRFDAGEERNDHDFVDALASLADLYVNDAFGSSHRAHASVDGVCRRLPHAPGLLVEREIDAFSRILADPPRPFVAILGGAKVSDKLAVIDALLDKVDTLLIGGAMCFTFAKATGGHVGDSLVEDDRIDDVRAALARATELGKEIIVPVDVVCAERIEAGIDTVMAPPDAVPDGLMGLDVGPVTVELFAQRIRDAGAVLWNGPMGVFETPPFDAGTRGVAEAFAAADGFTVAGGGDSAAALRQMGLDDSIDHLSTGGGASLELIEKGDLPGLAALRSPDPS
jgi:phosphoglycerate kinase